MRKILLLIWLISTQSFAQTIKIVNNQTKPSKFVIRCARSITSEDSPVIVIDGIIAEYSKINYINPNDILSVNILKGSEASTLFGSRGWNGVIIINTKQSKHLIIQDTDTRKNLERASIKLLTAEKTPTFFVTDKNGEADLSDLMDSCVYSLEISCIGYKTKTVSFSIKELNSVIRLEKDYKLMKEVIIAGIVCTKQVVCKIECYNQILQCGFKGIPIKQEDSNVVIKDLAAFEIYPNPAAAFSIVSIKLKQEFDGQIQLVNSAGQIIRTFSSETHKNQMNIQLNSISAGVYFIRLISFNSNQSLTKKLIVK